MKHKTSTVLVIWLRWLRYFSVQLRQHDQLLDFTDLIIFAVNTYIDENAEWWCIINER